MKNQKKKKRREIHYAYEFEFEFDFNFPYFTLLFASNLRCFSSARDNLFGSAATFLFLFTTYDRT